MKNMYSGTSGAGMSFSALLQQAELVEKSTLIVFDPTVELFGISRPGKILGDPAVLFREAEIVDEKCN